MSDLHHTSAKDPQQAAIEALLRHCHKRRCHGKTPLFAPGHPADTLYYLVQGRVCTAVRRGDSELIVAYQYPGEFIGAVDVFLPTGPRQVEARTLEPSIVATIGYGRMRHLLAGELSAHAAQLLMLLGRQISVRLLEAHRQSGNLAFLDVQARILDILTDLIRQPVAFEHPGGLAVRIHRQELARMAACSREAAGKALKILEQSGSISVLGRTIVVLAERKVA